MLEDMNLEIQELDNSNKRSKSKHIQIRCPLPIYKLLYYYMKDSGVDNRSEALCDLIQYGFSYYSDKL